MPSGNRDRDYRESTRSPLAVEVRLEPSGSEEVLAVTANVSRGGMFVPLRPPRPVGTLLRLALTLPDLGEEVRGFGEVVWIRVRDESPERRAGMGVQFRHLEGQGAELLGRQLALVEGVEPEETAPAPAPAAAAPAEPGASRPPMPAAVAPTASPPEIEVPYPPQWGVSHPPIPGAPTPDAAAPAAAGPAAPLPRQAAAEPGAAGRRRGPSRGMLAASALLFALALAAFLLREPLAGWLVGAPAPAVPDRRAAAAAPPAEAAGSPAPAGGMAAGEASPAPPSPEAPVPEGPVEEGPAPEGPAQEAPAGRTTGAAAPAGPAGGEPATAPAPGGSSAAPGPEPSAPSPEPAPPPASASTEIREISWGEVGGETIVVITGDGAIAAERVDHQRVTGGAPRELIRIAGIARPYRRSEIPVGTSQVTRIRTGHHPDSNGGELYVVLDLASPAAAVDRVEALATGVRIYLRTGG